MSVENKFHQQAPAPQETQSNLEPESLNPETIEITEISQEEVQRLNKLFSRVYTNRKVRMHIRSGGGVIRCTTLEGQIKEFYLDCSKNCLRIRLEDDSNEGWPCPKGTIIEIVKSKEELKKSQAIRQLLELDRLF